ncbi:MAG: 50S ribosomal protein L10 [Clostridia bacterium]|nr:50S ribosomal protein L10 [Clostridia bacterium]
MSANFEAKKQVVEDIKAHIQESKSIVLVDYKGMTVAEDTELRNKFRENGVFYKVYKNTLLKRAFNELGISEFDNDLNNTTSVAFAKDEVIAAKIAFDTVKSLNDKMSVKSGYVDGAYLDAKAVKALASIPSKEGLLSMLAGTLQGFISGFARAIKAVADSKAE